MRPHSLFPFPFLCVFILISFKGFTQVPPYIFLRSSPSALSYTAPATVSFYATAYDPDGSIARVEFYLCGTKITETDTDPYDIILKDLTAGQYCVTAKAIDNMDSSALSYAITFTVTEPLVSCESVPVYAENSGYTLGSKVANDGHRYECKPWPYSGWCNGASWAYEPGNGAYWMDAWTDLGPCAEESLATCETTDPYLAGSSYGPGNQVAYDGIRYECKPWPYSGWCSGAAWAYAPGQGMYWQDAWISLGDCPSSLAKKSAGNEIRITPHPFEHTTTVQLETPEEILSAELYNSQGILLFSSGDLHQQELILGQDLATGYYILHLTTKTASYTKTLIKR